ncbi:kinase-like domain-containing protein, partial [Fomitopsis betulina]
FIDKIILDRYKLTEPLGPGAGYLALDLHPVPSSSREPVVRAVKVIKKAGPSNSWDTWRQRLEIALHQRVTGTPNILTLHATTEDDDFLYLVTDYHKYNMLQVVCYDRIPYIGNDELVRSVFVQLIDAVAVCHNRNVFHRDLKPENIRCNADGSEVYISNFGLATQQRFTSTYGYGTMSYKSPECIGEECDSDIYATRLGDIWALGVILVNMLTGCTPWDKAVTTDKDFNDFLHNDDYLRRTFAISEETIIMLERMFSIDPISRLTLDEVRSSFLEIPTFF